MEVSDQINRHSALPATVSLAAKREGETLRVELRSVSEPKGDFVLQLVRFLPKETVEILRGENAGKTLTYYNIVTDWSVVARWSGGDPLTLSVDAPGPRPSVVILQARKQGPILAAAVVR